MLPTIGNDFIKLQKDEKTFVAETRSLTTCSKSSSIVSAHILLEGQFWKEELFSNSNAFNLSFLQSST